MDLTLADNLKDQNPDFGVVLAAKGMLAWQVMELIREKQLQDGRWQRTDKGYQLHRNLSGDAGSQGGAEVRRRLVVGGRRSRPRRRGAGLLATKEERGEPASKHFSRIRSEMTRRVANFDGG